MLKPKNGNLQNPETEENVVTQEPQVEAGGTQTTLNNGGDDKVKYTKGGKPVDMQKKAAVKEFREAGLALAKEEDANGVVKGQDSNKVAYVIALGNPARMGTRTEGKKENIAVMEIVGWKFKALAPIQVPVCKREGIPKTDSMGYSSIEWVEVAEGQEFTLSPAELSEMIILEQYNGIFTGDEKNQVQMHITMPKVGKNKYAPNISLTKIRIDENTKPLKADVIPVATLNEGASKDSKSLKDYTVLPEYAEKFGYIFEEAPKGSTRVAGQKRKPGENAGELAAAMRAFKMKQRQGMQ